LSDESRTVDQVAKDKNPSLVVEKNFVMNEIQKLSTWLSNGALAWPNAERRSVPVRVCKRLEGPAGLPAIANHWRRTYHVGYI
jgi:hypothetical protein